jgi:hypothetical protein
MIVPTPTSKPAMIKSGKGRVAITGGAIRKKAKAPPPIKPIKNILRHKPFAPLSSSLGAIALAVMPLIPATRPKAANKSQDANPINTPPASACNAAIQDALIFTPSFKQ